MLRNISLLVGKLILSIALIFLTKYQLLCEYQWQLIPFNLPATLTDIHFFDEDKGIIIGDSGTYLVTSNGGSNWLEFPKLTKVNLTSIKFIDSDFGIITSYDTLFITKDGAKTWQKTGFGLDVNFYQIGFTDKNNIWVSGDFGTLLYSSNGGDNWNNINIGTNKALFNISVLNKNKLIVSGSDGYIARMINNGELTEYLDVGFDSFITSMLFLNDNTGFVCIDSLKILKTTDAGSNWEEVYKGDPDDWVMSLKFVNNLEAWAVSDMGLILRTTDGGNTWKEVLNTGRPLNSCFFLNRNFGFISGFMGTIYKYSDFLNILEEPKNHVFANSTFLSDGTGINLKGIEIGDRIELYNILGVKIYSALAGFNELTIPLHEFTSGNYFLRVNNQIIRFLKY